MTTAEMDNLQTGERQREAAWGSARLRAGFYNSSKVKT